jgi:hypothetical protein
MQWRKAEVESGSSHFSFNTLGSRRFQLGFDKVNLHRPTPSMSAYLVTGNSQLAATTQGLTLVHFSAQRKHILWNTLGA